MDNIPYKLRPYKNCLSPFGQKVFQVLVTQWRSEISHNTSRADHPRGECTEQYRNLNKRSAPRDSSEQRNYTSRKKCTLQFLEKETPLVPTPLDLLNSTINPEKNYIDVYDTKCISIPAIEDNWKTFNNFEQFKENTKTDTCIISNTDLVNFGAEPSLGSCSDKENVTWSNMFDSELFDDTIGNCNYGVENNCIREDKVDAYPIIQPVEIFKKPNTAATERIKTTNSTVNSKIGKKTVTKNTYRKENFTKTVRNWLNDVEQTLVDANDSENKELEVIENKRTEKKIRKKTSRKAIHTELKKYSDIVESKDHSTNEIDFSKKGGPAPSAKKNVIQAQLANKGGKMKFDKPKNVDIDITEDSLNAPIAEVPDSDKECTKTKKSKSKFVAPIKSQIPVKDISYKITTIDVTNVEEYKNIFNQLDSAEVFVILIYRNGFSQLNGCYTEDTCVPEGLVISITDDEIFYYFTNINESFRTIFSRIFEQNTIICYEGKNILVFLSHFNMSFKPLAIWDTKIGGALLDPENPPETFSDVQKLVGFAAEFTIATDCSLQKAAWYTTLLRGCAAKLWTQLMENSLWSIFVNLEMRLLPIIADMECRGVTVDLDELKSMEHLLMTKLKAVEQECYKAAGRSFQINSTVQLRALLFDELKLDAKTNVKIRETLIKGDKSTSEATLRSLMGVHPLPKLILEYRHLHKAHATFLSGIAQHVKDGIVKTTWVQTAAATGRIASNNPNLQAIPKAPFSLVMFPDAGDVESPVVNFRSMYISRGGHGLLAADFMHVECRVLAHAAADAPLLAALRSDDLFRVLAAKLNKPEEQVCPAERERTKRVVYASLYGCGARALMDVLRLGYGQALAILASFNRTFPSLKSFGRGVVSQCAARGGRLETLGGRARTLRNINSHDFAARAHAERQAVNFVVQGSAADLCKMAMILTEERLRGHSPPLRAYLLLQIHDELVWEVHDDDLEEVAGIVKEVMEGCALQYGVELRLPAALAAGRRWGRLAPYAPATRAPPSGHDTKN